MEDAKIAIMTKIFIFAKSNQYVGRFQIAYFSYSCEGVQLY